MVGITCEWVVGRTTRPSRAGVVVSPLSRCPLCGHESESFGTIEAGRQVCPQCGETFGHVSGKPIDVSARTLAAGVTLTIAGGFTLLASLGWLTVNFAFEPPMPQPMPGQDPGVAAATRFGMRIGQVVPPGIGIVIGSLGIVGGVHLVRQRRWPLAVAGAFATALPCTCGFPLGLPVGVWSLFVLAHPQVRAVFEAHRSAKHPSERPERAA